MERIDNGLIYSRILGIHRKLREFVSGITSYIGTTTYNLVPKGLFGRTLLILLIPILLLQATVLFLFMERHWELVTRRLSEGIARDIAVMVTLVEKLPTLEEKNALMSEIQTDFEMFLSILPENQLPKPGNKPFFNPLDRLLSESIRIRVGKPFWIDTVGNSQFVEIRILLDDSILRVVARRSHTYASNSHIFVVWLLSSSTLLILISILFLRNQIKPIRKLASAAESLGKGRSVKDFKPSGASEIRRASVAFIEMRHRIERHIEQRTAMLAGVSHDLRTILTRFQLQIALLNQDSQENSALHKDIDEMNHILDSYLAFAKGDEAEEPKKISVPKLIKELVDEAKIAGMAVEHEFEGEPSSIVKPNAFKRCLSNLVVNSCRYATEVKISGVHNNGWLTVSIHDNGPGIPIEERDNVFRPFYRLDDSRNQDTGSTGLGLAIALDIARGHGGNVTLKDSPLGGLLARVRIPA